MGFELKKKWDFMGFELKKWDFMGFEFKKKCILW